MMEIYLNSNGNYKCSETATIQINIGLRVSCCWFCSLVVDQKSHKDALQLLWRLPAWFSRKFFCVTYPVFLLARNYRVFIEVLLGLIFFLKIFSNIRSIYVSQSIISVLLAFFSLYYRIHELVGIILCVIHTEMANFKIPFMLNNLTEMCEERPLQSVELRFTPPNGLTGFGSGWYGGGREFGASEVQVKIPSGALILYTRYVYTRCVRIPQCYENTIWREYSGPVLSKNRFTRENMVV